MSNVKRAFVKYTKDGKLIPGSLIVTTKGGYPVDGLYQEVPVDLCCESVFLSIGGKHRAFVKYTKSGEIIPGSLIITNKGGYPKDGLYYEVNVNYCCITTFNPDSVVINGIRWMSKNLDIDTYRNGDPIPQVTDPTEWANLTTGAWCYYNNDPAMGAIYGKLYNWYAVNDPRGLAPKGWRVPSNSDFETLSNFYGGDTDSGCYLKSTTPDWGANLCNNNLSGWTGLPGKRRTLTGIFDSSLSIGWWWSSSIIFPPNPTCRFLFAFFSSFNTPTASPNTGNSVRLVKN